MKSVRNRESNTAGSHLQVGAKQWVHVDIGSKIIDTGNSERQEDRRGVSREKLHTGYNVH